MVREAVAARPRTPTEELLLCCARRELDAAARVRLDALLDGDAVAWPAFLALAQRNRLVPLAHRHLSASGRGRVPTAVLAPLRAAYHRNAQRSLLLTGELREVHALFAAEGIAMLPYKGPTLAQQLYGSIALREMSDLDVLVAPEHVLRARALLMARGYRKAPYEVGVPDDLLLSSDSNFVLVRDADRQILELHWAFAAGRHVFPLGFDEAWRRAGELALAGARLPCFAAEDLLLILCFHGSRHMWERLEWITGVAEVVRHQPVDWDALLGRARRMRCTRSLLLGLRLAGELLDAPVPAALLERNRVARRSTRLVATVWRRLFEGGEQLAHTLGLPFHAFQLAISDGVRRKLRYLYYAVFAPSKEDYAAVPLPAMLFPLYALIRPLRLAGRYGARLAGRAH